MKILFIVGNGFNFMIEGIIRSKPASDIKASQILIKNDTANNIREITGLWRKFQEVFAELHLQFQEKGIKISDEDLIRLINSVINLFSNINGFQKILPAADIENLKNIFNNFLLDKIREIAEEFRKHQKKESYSRIRDFFPEFANSIEDIISRNKINKLDFFTTNYDGILETLLSKRPKGFITKDGFINSRYVELLELVPSYLRDKVATLNHIHGSYRFTKYYGKTYKTKDNVINHEPVMVFNNPSVKEEIIRNDNVLSEHMRYFEECLSKYDRLIIFGNSMIAEPHLKNAIKRNFNNRPNTSIIICSRDPRDITTQIKPYYRGDIFEETTVDIQTENDLIAFFFKILS